jgi:hypothetical protein
MDVNEQLRIIKKGVAELISEGELLEKLKNPRKRINLLS